MVSDARKQEIWEAFEDRTTERLYPKAKEAILMNVDKNGDGEVSFIEMMQAKAYWEAKLWLTQN